MKKKYAFVYLIFQFFFVVAYCQAAFNSEAAIKKSNDIVNEYWETYMDSVSRYYGGYWLDNYAKHQYIGNISFLDDYLGELENNDIKSIRMDCTIYCARVLKAGMGVAEYSKLIGYHRGIWNSKGLAGWSVGYLLVDRFGWKAYAFIEPDANLHPHYISYFKNSNEYPVWNQPNIKIEEYYVLGRDIDKIENLLKKYDFSWGLSQDGIHTWITHYSDLLECHWDGVPAAKYNLNISFPDLFETTEFIEFKDYDVHIIVVPPADS